MAKKLIKEFHAVSTELYAQAAQANAAAEGAGAEGHAHGGEQESSSDHETVDAEVVDEKKDAKDAKGKHDAKKKK